MTQQTPPPPTESLDALAAQLVQTSAAREALDGQIEALKKRIADLIRYEPGAHSAGPYTVKYARSMRLSGKRASEVYTRAEYPELYKTSYAFDTAKARRKFAEDDLLPFMDPSDRLTIE